MPKVKIYYPQILIVAKELEITQEQLDTLGEEHNLISDLIWNNMAEDEKMNTNGKNWVTSAYSSNYARFEVLNGKS